MEKLKDILLRLYGVIIILVWLSGLFVIFGIVARLTCELGVPMFKFGWTILDEVPKFTKCIGCFK